MVKRLSKILLQTPEQEIFWGMIQTYVNILRYLLVQTEEVLCLETQYLNIDDFKMD